MIEDARFYEHSGVDYTGVLRAGPGQLQQGQAKARPLSPCKWRKCIGSEKTIKRAVQKKDAAGLQMEHALSKDQILDIYMSQIFLGNRAYGFAAAAEAYFGKSIKDVNLAEAAMLAGLPKAPSPLQPDCQSRTGTYPATLHSGPHG